MSKTSSPELFHLIKSLSKSEKRHFKVFSEKHVIGEGNKYVALFDAMDEQKEYEENVLSKNFSHFPSLKKRLYDHILKSLAAYHSEKTADARLNNFLRYIRILFDKGLYKQAGKMVEHARELALQYENFHALLGCFSWEIELARVTSFVGISEEYMTGLFNKLHGIIEQYKNAREYQHLSMQMHFRMRRTGTNRSTADRKKYEEIFRHPYLKSEKNALSLEARYYYYLGHSAYHFMQNNFAKAYLYNNCAMKIIEENPQLLHEKCERYLTISQNVMICLYQLKRYSEVLVVVKRYRETTIGFEELADYMRSSAFYFANTIELMSLTRLGEFEKAVERIPEIEAEFIKYEIAPLEKEYECLYFTAAFRCYFGAGKYHQANTYLNKVIHETSDDMRSDIHCYARILSLILHYEMGNQDLMEYMVKWTYRYLSKRNRLYKFETIVLDFIRKKLNKIDTKEKKKIAFTELKEELLKLSKDPFEKKPLEDFEFIEWLESKIENKPFAEIVRKKTQVTASN